MVGKHPEPQKACDVSGCEEESSRSLSMKQVSKTNLPLKSRDLKSVHLCKTHYKEFKKESKTERDLDRIY